MKRTELPTHSSTVRRALIAWAIGSAVFIPLVTAYQLPPQPAFTNQWVACVLWVVACTVLLWAATVPRRGVGSAVYALVLLRLRRSAAVDWLLAVWLAVLFGVTLSLIGGRTPLFAAIPSLCVLGCVLTATWLIAKQTNEVGDLIARAVLIALLLAALVNAAIAVVQTYAPSWHDERWIAQLFGGRAYGNLRQPNLLALLSLWGLLAASAWLRAGAARAWMLAGMPLLLFALWLSGSRTGWLALPIVLICAALHWQVNAAQQPMAATRRHGLRRYAILAAAAIIVLAVLWLTLGGIRVERSVSIAQRASLWRDVLVLIAENPWLGVGFGQLNFAWTLTPLPARAPDVFDHAHNLPLHLAAELGIPIALTIVTLATLAIYLSMRHSRAQWRWIAFGVIAVALWHSLFEYPLWFAHFLIPCAAVAALLANSASVGVNVKTKPQQHEETAIASHGSMLAKATRPLALLATLAFAAWLAIWLALGYRAISRVYEHANDIPKASSLARAAQAHSVYGYYGDYALIMLSGDEAALDLFSRPIRGVIDEKLLTAWARVLDRAGRDEEATFVVARAREFKTDPSFEYLPAVPPNVASAPLRFSIDSFRTRQ
jgi:O-antigen ligase